MKSASTRIALCAVTTAPWWMYQECAGLRKERMSMADNLLFFTKQGNICWDCENACGNCSWSALDPVTGKPQFKPVPGWTAEPVTRIEQTGRFKHKTETYKITACPQFVKTPERNILHRRIVNQGENQENLKYRRVCPVCQSQFSAATHGTVYCCFDCRHKADLVRKAEYRAKRRMRLREERSAKK